MLAKCGYSLSARYIDSRVYRCWFRPKTPHCHAFYAAAARFLHFSERISPPPRSYAAEISTDRHLRRFDQAAPLSSSLFGHAITLRSSMSPLRLIIFALPTSSYFMTRSFCQPRKLNIAAATSRVLSRAQDAVERWCAEKSGFRLLRLDILHFERPYFHVPTFILREHCIASSMASPLGSSISKMHSCSLRFRFPTLCHIRAQFAS